MKEIAQRVREAFTGPVESIRTPFDEHGSIDFDGLDRYVDVCIDGGSGALVLTYGDSLYSLPSRAEIAEVTRAVYRRGAGRAYVCAATGIWSTTVAVEFAEFCRDLGLDILMALPPDWGHSCGIDEFVDYYDELSRILSVMVVTNVFKPRGDDFGLTIISKPCAIV